MFDLVMLRTTGRKNPDAFFNDKLKIIKGNESLLNLTYSLCILAIQLCQYKFKHVAISVWGGELLRVMDKSDVFNTYKPVQMVHPSFTTCRNKIFGESHQKIIAYGVKMMKIKILMSKDPTKTEESLLRQVSL